ncbi:MAG: nicotinamide-nucleotide adenylyltransferase [Candidatus Aramenus sp.]|jgi:nicotinamide-nucleotide adenylyltransferase|nr:nicotinamide-nucleotide adenylyltransferase [Candidatus Aramenus sp.]
MRALFPGRFQPFHLGHLNVVRWAFQNFDEVVILVGSSSESHTLYNPFTAGERIEMIFNSVKDEVSKVFIVPLMESFENKNWIHEVELIAPRFDVVISGNPLVVAGSKEYRVIPPPQFNREKYNSTLIRSLMLKGENWRELVPQQVYEYIKVIGGEERIREIARTDKVED